MQADYFRLCYLLVEGGLYVDADDACIASDISSLFHGFGLKVQPLCYDIGSDSIVSPTEFLHAGASNEGWIFYFNNNPLIASQGDPAASSTHRDTKATVPGLEVHCVLRVQSSRLERGSGLEQRVQLDAPLL
jgi:hypothetical protein